MKRLKKPCVSIGFDGFRGNQQQPERAEIGIFQTLRRKPPGAQAIVVCEVGRRRSSGPISFYRVEPQARALNEVSRSEAVSGAALSAGYR